ncbi:MAG: hypothetical protein V1802_00810 [Candidatus Aenigmatarchaeota archaeon]
MVVKQEVEKLVSINSQEAYRNLLAGIKKEKWDIIYKEKEYLEVFGITSMLGGSTLLSLATEAARYVPFFVRIFSQGKKSRILIIAAGSENWLGWDFGRNKKVAEKILNMCLDK